MNWLASLSTSRALAIALLWPATLIILPLVGFRLWTFWMSRRTLLHAEFHVAPGGWVGILVVLLVPPAVFLIAWVAARR